MGTRNTTMVILDGQTKVAQYGQWDGYPEGNGTTVLQFCKDADWDKFKEQLKKCQWATQEYKDKAYKDAGHDGKSNWVSMDVSERFAKVNPQLSRDMGADILDFILNFEGDTLFITNSEDFNKDSLFCEWSYLIDLDEMNLEVYEGFQAEPQEGNRYGTEKPDDSEYYPVKLVKTYSLSDLPTQEVFLNDLKREEETEQ